MGKIENYPLNFSTWDESEINAACKVIHSGFCTSGNIVQSFESMISNYFGSRFAVFCNSGSSANLLAVAALFFRKQNPLIAGDEVIVPAVSWSTTYFPLYQYGLKPKFVDVDINTFNIDVEKVKEAICDDTKAIMAVNILGNSNNFDQLMQICEENNLILLEDNCESMGAKYKSKYCGTFGLLGTFSTFFSHHISTVEGGIILTDDEELYQIMICLRSHGWSRNLPKGNKICIKSDNDFKELFRFYLPGYNLRSNEIFAAIGLEQLNKLPVFLENRTKNYNYIKSRIGECKGLIMQELTENSQSSWFGFGFLVNSRNEITKYLISKNIECRPIVSGNFLNNPVLKLMEHSIHGDLNNAQQLDERGFYIGNSHISMEEYIDYFINVFNEHN